MTRITRKFIAEQAGVSPTTVSDVVNGNPKARVSSESRAKVLEIARKYNYVPNISARTLVTGKTYNIGFIYKDSIVNFLHDPFGHEIFIGLESEIERHDYSLVFSLLKDDRNLNSSVKRMLYGNCVDGIVLTGAIEPRLARTLEQSLLPYVLIDYILPGMDHSAVLPDNIGGAKAATNYLINEGCRHICFLNGDTIEQSHPSYVERPEGYLAAVKSAGLTPEIRSVPPDIDGTYLATLEMLQEMDIPDAFLTAGDQIAIGLTHAIANHDASLLEKVRIIGFDNISWSQKETPALSTVHVPKDEMGSEAVRLLLNNIEQPTGSKKIIRLSTSLVIRDT